MEYGARFRKMRKRAGLSQEDLSGVMHMSRSNVSRLESNKLKISFDDAIKWAQATNSQDMLIALVCNIDIASATQIVTESLKLVGAILLGGLI
ncbi:helix-turn-helix transcriptional regulator [Virgibacillus salarius]|uniref:helix-turn-helix domain-containing protein n=1 Tax=Virgibacillus salarius TaxID=447199 RepID=UPI00249031B6|nr:helix-turn-helix transcriptional regulator [Virgibacillus salarius]WBX81328.1 helix-turn-helix transcriptional regulator [Virgibacillus salarius]